MRNIDNVLDVEYQLQDRYKAGVGSESSRIAAVLARAFARIQFQ
jgi:hypothetical protein